MPISEVRVPRFPECWESCGNCAQGEVIVAEVHVRPGMVVDRDAFVITLETGKVALDIPSPYKGMVLEVFVAVGDCLQAGQLLCCLDME